MGTSAPDLREDDLRHLLGAAADTFPVPADGPVLVLDAHAQRQATVVPLVRRRRVQLASAAAAVVVLGTAAGLVFAGDGVDRVGRLAGAPRTPAPAAAAAPPVADQLRAESGRRALASAPQEFSASSGGKAVAPPAAAVPTDGARVVKTGALALVVEDGEVTPTLTEVRRLAEGAGGLVAAEKTAETGPTPSGSITLRVPVAAFERVVVQVREVGGEVRTATTSGTDVTAQYADLEAQLRTLTAARERFLAILAGADRIGDVLAVQQRVDEVTGRIDRLEGQRRVLAAQSDSATLEVTVTEADDPVARQSEPDTGLSKAFSDAGTGFTTGVEALVRLSGRALLVALLAGLAFAVLRVGWRLSRRRLV